MSPEVTDPVVVALLALAEERGVKPSSIPLSAVIARAGIARATFFRRYGSRQALDDALRAAGLAPGERRDVRTRAIEAAAAIIRAEGIGGITLEAVAEQAGCSVPALHNALGGREGLLVAVFERYSPILSAEALVAADPPSLDAAVRGLYGLLLDAFMAEPQLVAALLGDAISRPAGPTGRLLRETVLPRVTATIGGWMQRAAAKGWVRPLPPFVFIELLVGPLFLHLLAEGLLGTAVHSGLRREETIGLWTRGFCAAVGTTTAVPE